MVLVVAALSWVMVPTATGILTGSVLLAGVAFAVWMSLTTVVLGIWVSSLTVDSSPVRTHQPKMSPEGWPLPAGVTRQVRHPW